MSDMAGRPHRQWWTEQNLNIITYHVGKFSVLRQKYHMLLNISNQRNCLSSDQIARAQPDIICLWIQQKDKEAA